MCPGHKTEVGGRWTGCRCLPESRNQTLIRGVLFRRNLSSLHDGTQAEMGPCRPRASCPASFPAPPGDSPQLRHPIPGQSELGFPLPASYSLHKHSRPGLCTIGTLLVVGMHLTRKSVQTERGGGGCLLRAGGRHRRLGPQAGFSPSLGCCRGADEQGREVTGPGIWRRGNRETRSPEFNKFGKRTLKVR